MGEIKSTLDLVLEKTRHLSLSEEEKREQKQKDARGKLAVLLQRHQDGKLDAQKIAEELDELVRTDDGPDEALVREEIAGRIELGGDNANWLKLLQTRYRLDPSGVQSVEKKFRQAVEAAAERRREELKTELQRHRRIGGSAVVPNLDADRTWTAQQQSMAAAYRQRLAAALHKSP